MRWLMGGMGETMLLMVGRSTPNSARVRNSNEKSAPGPRCRYWEWVRILEARKLLGDISDMHPVQQKRQNLVDSQRLLLED